MKLVPALALRSRDSTLSVPRTCLCSQAFQIALALSDEIVDLETAGCKIIQVDEPALREGLPLKPEKKQG